VTGGAASKLRTILDYFAKHCIILPINETLATRMILSSVTLSCLYKGYGARWSKDSIVVDSASFSAVSLL